MHKFVSALLIAALALPAAALAGEETVMIKGTQRTIPATVTLPDGPGPFPFVVMYHGTGSNRHEAGNGYDLLAPELAEAGIASARFDFAGNGDSTADYKTTRSAAASPTGRMSWPTCATSSRSTTRSWACWAGVRAAPSPCSPRAARAT